MQVKSKKRKRSGFNLLEKVIVFVILGICLAAIWEYVVHSAWFWAIALLIAVLAPVFWWLFSRAKRGTMLYRRYMGSIQVATRSGTRENYDLALAYGREYYRWKNGGRQNGYEEQAIRNDLGPLTQLQPEE